jgi:hypothetical protein
MSGPTIIAFGTKCSARPSVISDVQAPVKSMVDGKIYDSKAALRATYMPSGNREGKRYIEVGNDKSIIAPGPRQKPKADRKGIRDALDRAEAKINRGEVTPHTYQTKVLTRPGPI